MKVEVVMSRVKINEVLISEDVWHNKGSKMIRVLLAVAILSLNNVRTADASDKKVRDLHGFVQGWLVDLSE